MHRPETVYERYRRTGYIGGPDHPGLMRPREPFPEPKAPDPKVQRKFKTPDLTHDKK